MAANGVHGARPGHECLSSAWPAQARLEEAMLENKDRSAATLDYTRFFDRFDADFYMDMLTASGYPVELASIQRAISANLKRHMKIAGSYGEYTKITKSAQKQTARFKSIQKYTKVCKRIQKYIHKYVRKTQVHNSTQK